MKNVKYGKCVRCGKTYDAVPDLTNCECGGILDIVYDYDYIKSVLTDSAVMYQSRIEELNQMYGAYNAHEASLDHNLHMLGLKTDSMLELTYTERKRVHNLKYYTWVEQQQMNVEDLNAQWYDTKNTWDAVHAQAKELDQLICEFNEATGLLKAL